MTDHLSRGRGTVALPEMRRAGVGVCLATLLARARPGHRPVLGFDRRALDFPTQAGAYASAQAQLAYYRLLEQQRHVRLLRTSADLTAQWDAWTAAPHREPIGLIIAMEGADPIVFAPSPSAPGEGRGEGDFGFREASDARDHPHPSPLPAQRKRGRQQRLHPADEWFAAGVRSVGLAHYGPGVYAHGTGGDGPLTPAGRELLDALDRLGMILDLTHCAEPGFFEALDRFHGAVHASHNMARALVPGDRQFSDEQLRRLITRGGVIGMALDAWMIVRGWERGVSSPAGVSLQHVADHVDHICQLAGDCRHVGIGSDLDGGFGTEQTPADVQSIADLQELGSVLARRGYSDGDIDGVFSGNWLRFFTSALPA